MGSGERAPRGESFRLPEGLGVIGDRVPADDQAKPLRVFLGAQQLEAAATFRRLEMRCGSSDSRDEGILMSGNDIDLGDLDYVSAYHC